MCSNPSSSDIAKMAAPKHPRPISKRGLSVFWETIISPISSSLYIYELIAYKYIYYYI